MPSSDTNPLLYRKQLASEAEVTERIEQLAAEIIKQFSGQNPLFVCLLRGGVPFATQLMFAITEQDPHFHPEMDYMTVSRYGNSRVAGEPRVAMDLASKTQVSDRPVIVLDDMIDKGATYIFTKKHLENKGAKQVYLAALVRRNVPREADADFYCFDIDSEEWLTGMGLDDSRIANEANRWAGYIAIANANEE